MNFEDFTVDLCSNNVFYDVSLQLDALAGCLNPKGERERALKRQLEKYYPRIR